MTTSLMKVEPAAKEVPQALGFYVCIEIWVTPDKIGSVYVPNQTKQEDKYSRPVGRVVSVGRDAYSGAAYANGPWVKIGDHVMFDRGNAIANNYFGVAYAFCADDKIVAKIDDPNAHKKINAGDKP
jgi:co-chaperonin GroES (HSP10)